MVIIVVIRVCFNEADRCDEQETDARLNDELENTDNSRHITGEDIVPEKFPSQNGTFQKTPLSLRGERRRHYGKCSLLKAFIGFISIVAYTIYRDAREEMHTLTSRHNLTWRILESDCDFYKAKRKTKGGKRRPGYARMDKLFCSNPKNFPILADNGRDRREQKYKSTARLNSKCNLNSRYNSISCIVMFI